jgi:ectoine hydroxylase-related dioxygenase (phytanoyl-CoA dioxygenase family)
VFDMLTAPTSARAPPHRSIKRAVIKNTGFPVGVLMSLHDKGAFHLWPGSFDAKSVRAQDRITVHLNAGDIILFHGALVHEGAGYEGAAGEYHMRLHFYTQSAGGPNVWPIADETERVDLV